MYKVKLMNDFMHGAIWIYEDDIPSNYSLIDDDDILNELNRKTEELYNSYFEFDSHDKPLWFNEKLQKETNSQMLDYIAQIKNRLNEINDGTFIIEDYISTSLK